MSTFRNNSIEVLFPRCEAIWNVGDEKWDRLEPNRYGQKPVGTNIGKCLFKFESIDLSAFFVQDRTFFPVELVTQTVGTVDCSASADWNNSAKVVVYDIISAVPINGQELADGIVSQEFPGFSEFPLDNQFIMYGSYKVYAANSTNSIPGYMQLVQSNNFGSGKPTAAERLYCYRFIVPDSNAELTAAATLMVPPTRYEILGQTDIEDELERIYRLRQSYEQLERA